MIAQNVQIEASFAAPNVQIISNITIVNQNVLNLMGKILRSALTMLPAERNVLQNANTSGQV